MTSISLPSQVMDDPIALIRRTAQTLIGIADSLSDYYRQLGKSRRNLFGTAVTRQIRADGLEGVNSAVEELMYRRFVEVVPVASDFYLNLDDENRRAAEQRIVKNIEQGKGCPLNQRAGISILDQIETGFIDHTFSSSYFPVGFMYTAGHALRGLVGD